MVSRKDRIKDVLVRRVYNRGIYSEGAVVATEVATSSYLSKA